MDKIITKSGLSLLRRIIAADDLGKSLVVTFDSKDYPIEKFDLHYNELNILEKQKYIEFENLDIRDRREPGGIYDHQTMVIFTGGEKISGTVRASGLGRYVSEDYERDDTRYQQTNRQSTVALWLSFAAIVVSILVAILK